MASKNVETLRAAHESWNRRDFQGIVRNAAEDLVYTDHARALTLNNRDKFRQWTRIVGKGLLGRPHHEPRVHRRWRRGRCPIHR